MPHHALHKFQQTTGKQPLVLLSDMVCNVPHESALQVSQLQDEGLPASCLYCGIVLTTVTQQACKMRHALMDGDNLTQLLHMPTVFKKQILTGGEPLLVVMPVRAQ